MGFWSRDKEPEPVAEPEWMSDKQFEQDTLELGPREATANWEADFWAKHRLW